MHHFYPQYAGLYESGWTNWKGQDLGIVVSAISGTEPWLQCNASLAGTNFGDDQLQQLGSLGPNLRWLDLGGTRVSDAGLAVLEAMKK